MATATASFTAIDSIAEDESKSSVIAELRSTKTIRKRASALLARARRDGSAWFSVNDGAMLNAATLVAELTQARYPTLKIPYHSRWRHFEAGGVDRAAQLNAALAGVSAAEKAIAQIWRIHQASPPRDRRTDRVLDGRAGGGRA